MIIDRVRGNLRDETEPLPAGVRLERVVLPQDALLRRVQRVRSDAGRELGLNLTGAQLRRGDVLWRGSDAVVVVDVEDTDVLAIAPRTGVEMGRVAHALGNRHLQAQFLAPGVLPAAVDGPCGVMLIPFDHTAAQFLDHVGVPHRRAALALDEPFRHAEHTH